MHKVSLTIGLRVRCVVAGQVIHQFVQQHLAIVCSDILHLESSGRKLPLRAIGQFLEILDIVFLLVVLQQFLQVEHCLVMLILRKLYLHEDFHQRCMNIGLPSRA